MEVPKKVRDRKKKIEYVNENVQQKIFSDIKIVSNCAVEVISDKCWALLQENTS